MNRFYLMVPALLLAGFGFIYHQSDATTAREADARATEAAHARRTESEKRLAEERKAAADADQRSAERTEAERRAEAAAHEAWLTETRRLTDDGARVGSDCDRLSAQVATLQDRLHALQGSIGPLEHETFELQNALEQTQIDLTNAQLEVQRLTAMLIARSR